MVVVSASRFTFTRPIRDDDGLPFPEEDLGVGRRAVVVRRHGHVGAHDVAVDQDGVSASRPAANCVPC